MTGIRTLFTAALFAAALAATSCSTISRLVSGRPRTETQTTAAREEPTGQERTATVTLDRTVREGGWDTTTPATEETRDAAKKAAGEPRDPSVPVHLPQWDTVNLFAYRGVALSDLPEVVAVELDEAHGFCAPAVGRLMSPYGRRRGRSHNGTDVSVALGQEIHCAFDGVVRLSRWNSGGFGHIVIVRHPSGLETYYAHLSKRLVHAGDVVKAGQTIGLGGRTGRASAVHLHFETRYCDQSFDAERLIDFTTGELRTRTLALHRDFFSIDSHAGDGDDLGDILVDGAEGDLAENLGENSDGDPASQPISAADFVPTTAARAAVSASTSTAARKPATQAVYHKIRGGDTLYSLARRYGTTVAKLCSLNGISSRTTLRIGRNLRMK